MKLPSPPIAISAPFFLACHAQAAAAAVTVKAFSQVISRSARELRESHLHSHRQRQLQLSNACLSAYETLFNNNTEFNATATTYYDNWDTVTDSVDFDTACSQNGGTVNCNLPQSVAGSDEFLAACTVAGGTQQTWDLDTSCNLAIDGDAITASIDFPPLYDCLPPECSEEEIKQHEEDLWRAIEIIWEASFGLAGFTSVDCVQGASTSSGASHTLFGTSSLSMAAVVVAVGFATNLVWFSF